MILCVLYYVGVNSSLYHRRVDRDRSSPFILPFFFCWHQIVISKQRLSLAIKACVFRGYYYQNCLLLFYNQRDNLTISLDCYYIVFTTILSLLGALISLHTNRIVLIDLSLDISLHLFQDKIICLIMHRIITRNCARICITERLLFSLSTALSLFFFKLIVSK